MANYRSPASADDHSDWVDINHPLNRISLPLYNLGLEVEKRRWYVVAVLVALVSSLTAVILILTLAHTPRFYWITQYMRLVVVWWIIHRTSVGWLLIPKLS